MRYALLEKDLGVIISETPAVSAKSLYPKPLSGRPIKVTQDSLKHGPTLKAVIVNSAIANACTGEQGLKDAYTMRESFASQLGIEPELVAISSTGVIGEHLDMEKIHAGISTLKETPAGSGDFEEAILTTDTVIKQTCYELAISGKTVTIGGGGQRLRDDTPEHGHDAGICDN